MTYELWDNEQKQSFFARTLDEAYWGKVSALGDSAQVVYSVEAASWDEAMEAVYAFLGWGTYRPLAGTDGMDAARSA